MWSDDLADNGFVVLAAYLAVGIPLNFYLYHDVIDRHWRPVVELRRYSIGYGILAGAALVLLFLYGILQVAVDDYKEGGAAFLSCAIAIYGLYLCRRQTLIMRFFHNHLQWRANAMASVYKNDGRRADGVTAVVFPDGYEEGKAGGHISSTFLDDNYPGEGPRVTWLQCKPEVKDLTEMAVRTGLWIRLAVTSSRGSFDKGLRPRSIPSGDSDKVRTDTSRAWTVAIIKQHFETEIERRTDMVAQTEDVETFSEWVDGKPGTLSNWREILSRAPESEWKEALAEFRSNWTEGMEEEGVAFEVYLALALHRVAAEDPAESPRGCWSNCAALRYLSTFCCCRRRDGEATLSGLQSLDMRNVGRLREHVEGQIHAVLGNRYKDGFVTSTVLMVGFPEDDLKLGWLRRVQQLAGVWHHLAESTAADPSIQLDRRCTQGVDLVVALALLLDVNTTSFEFSQDSVQPMEETLGERKKLVVFKIQGGEAEPLLKESLRRLELMDALASDIAQAQYTLGKFLQDQVSFDVDSLGVSSGTCLAHVVGS